MATVIHNIAIIFNLQNAFLIQQGLPEMILECVFSSSVDILLIEIPHPLKKSVVFSRGQIGLSVAMCWAIPGERIYVYADIRNKFRNFWNLLVVNS